MTRLLFTLGLALGAWAVFLATHARTSLWLGSGATVVVLLMASRIERVGGLRTKESANG